MLAADYHWLYDDVGLRLGTATPGVRAALHGLPSGARVLDAACGLGLDAVALARRGCRVTGADASPAMIRQARDRARSAGLEVDLLTRRWVDLPDHLPAGSFEAVLCTGNAIAHARGRNAMVEALRAFHDLLRPGGRLILDAQHWEQVLARGVHVVDDPEVVARAGRRRRRRYHWHPPADPTAPVRLDVELVDLDGSAPIRHRVELYPFSVGEVRERLATAGFAPVDHDAAAMTDRYTVVAHRPDEHG